MLIARSVHPLPGEAERKERLLVAHRRLREPPRARRRRSHRRRVHLRRSRARLARGARPHPQVRRDRDGRRRRRQRGQQRRGARRPRRARRPSPATMPKGGGCWRAFTAASTAGTSCAPQRVSHAGQDADPRRAACTRPSSRSCASIARPGWPLAETVSRAFVRKLGPALADCDAVLLSDYGSGLVTPALAAAVRAQASRRARAAGRCRCCSTAAIGCSTTAALTTCTPNESEVEQALGVHIDDDPDVLERAGRTLLKRTGMQAVLITRGSRGMALFQPKQADDSHSDLRIRRNRRRHRRRRYGHRDIPPRARRRRLLLRGRAAGQLRRRARRDEARHGHRLRARAERRRRRAITTRRSRTGRRKGRSRDGRQTRLRAQV